MAHLKRDYRPERSGLAVDIFAPEPHLSELHQLWSFYAQGGVRCHPLFSHHLDFYRPELAPSLAEAITAALERVERQGSYGHASGSTSHPRCSDSLIANKTTTNNGRSADRTAPLRPAKTTP